MDSFSFKKIKFFRSEGSRPVKAVVKNQTPGNNGTSKPIKNLIRHPHVFLVLFSLAIAWLISYTPSKALPEWEQGSIAPADVVVPEEMGIEDEETTQNRRQEAEDKVPPVYTLNPSVFLNTRIKIRGFFESGRDLIAEPLDVEIREEFIRTTNDTYFVELTSQTLRSLIRLEFSTTLEESLIDMIGRVSDEGIIVNKSLYTHNEQETGFTLVRGAGVENMEFISTVRDREEAKSRLTDLVNQMALPQEEKAILIALSHAFITANIDYDPNETDARKDVARNSIDPIFYTVKKGKVLIRKGDEVTDAVLGQIRTINQNLSAQPDWLINFIGSFILVGLLLYGLLYYLQTRRESAVALNRFVLIAATLILSLLLYKVSGYLSELVSESASVSFFGISESYLYAFPIQLGTLLITYLAGVHLALFTMIINSILFGYMFNSEFLVIYALIGGFAAILGVRVLGQPTRTPVLRAGLVMIAPVNVAAITAFHLLEGGLGPATPFLSNLFMGVLGGVIGSSLAFLLVPVCETLFGIVTQAKLVELANSDLPIFRKMAMEAPGSYHHSLVVASLVESAGEELGLDPMLLKAGALYHDIGKIKRPDFFIENRTRNFDRHQDLKPSMSTLVIINHVKEGVEQARKLRLPKKVKDIIEQHHGNSLVRYFFEKAKEEYDPEMQKIGEESYRYPGPRPNTKEAALVLLADSVEAASRSLKKPTKANLKRLITEIFNSNLQDGQLDESTFSLLELKQAAESFLSTLFTIYHPRMEYPGFDFEKRKIKTASNGNRSNDRNSKPAKKV
jgi:putative nucleotidyltransferase with HDIG domain